MIYMEEYQVLITYESVLLSIHDIQVVCSWRILRETRNRQFF